LAPGTRRPLTDEEIARRCPTCPQGYWWHGIHVCKRKTCKYLQPSKASIWFKDK